MARFTSRNFETRASKDGEKLEVEGYGLEWDKLSDEMGWWINFREKFVKGAFKEYIDKEDTQALIGHNMNNVVGRSKYKTLELKEDNTGLYLRCELPLNTVGRDLFESIKRRDIDGLSVGFDPKIIEWDERDEKNVIRIIKQADLPEISFTSWAVYESSNVDVRSKNPYEKFQIEKRNKEKICKNRIFLNKLYIENL